MDIEWSKTYITKLTQWEIGEGTFQVLDEERLTWIARVKTTQNSQQGKPEQGFTILVRATQHFVLDDNCLPALIDWCLKQAK